MQKFPLGAVEEFDYENSPPLSNKETTFGKSLYYAAERGGAGFCKMHWKISQIFEVREGHPMWASNGG
jgi:hypothetical protein